MSIPNHIKNIYSLFKNDNLYKNYQLDDLQMKKYIDKDLNIYRYDKIIHSSINPNFFFHYFKDHNVRQKLLSLVKFIKIKNKINDNEWIEEIDMYDKILNVKVICLDYQILMYVIDSDTNATYQLYNFIIRKIDDNYLVRIEMAFNIFDFDQELEVKNQINVINSLEKIILLNNKKN